MPYPTSLHLIGGNKGRSFSFTGMKNGASLEKIGVWVGGWQVKAVKVWLSDGRKETFGEPDGPYKEYTFKAGECFTSLSLWGNGAGTRLGAIKFKTNKGGSFFVKMTSWGLKTEYHIDVCSGFCLGVEGSAGADIDNMGFTFLDSVQSVALTNVSYPTLNQLIPEVTLEEIRSNMYENSTSSTQKQNIQIVKKFSKTSSWSVSNNITSTFTLEVKAGIPGIVEASAGFSYSVGRQTTSSLERKEEKEESLSFDLDIPSGKKMNLYITIGRCSFDMPYIGTVQIICKNGSVLEYETKGKYKGVTYTDIRVKTKEYNL